MKFGVFLFSIALSATGYSAEIGSTTNSAPSRMREVIVNAQQDKGTGARRATTGTKTDTALWDVPQSVQVVPQEQIKEQSAHNVDDTIRNVSGVTQSSSSNYGFFNNYLSRGLNVNFVRDGIPDALTVNGYTRTLSNVEQVEVLKGPGSSLYGSGSPGGTVNLVTKKPLSTPAYDFETTFGSFSTHRVIGDATGPTSNKELNYRVITDYSMSDGFRDISNRIAELHPSLQWNPSPEQTLLASFDFHHVEMVADTAGIPFHNSTTAALRTTSLIQVSRDAKFYTPFSDTTTDVFRGSLNHSLHVSDHLTLHENLMFMHRDLDLTRNSSSVNFTSLNTLSGRSLRDQSDASDEVLLQFEPVFNLETGPIFHTLLTGFEFHGTVIDTARSQSNLAPIADVYQPVIPETSKSNILFSPHFDRTLTTAQYGLYLQDQIDFTEQWKMRLGARVDRFDITDEGTYNTRFDSSTAFSGALAGNGQSFIPNTPTTRFESSSRSDTRLSGQAGLVYQPVQATSFYGGVSVGHQAIVTTEAARSAFAPESSTQFEIGNRSSLFGDKVEINASVFEVTRDNFLQTINGTPVPVGKQRTRGMECDITTHPFPGWTLLMNYAYQDAYYAKLLGATGAPSPDVDHQVTGVPLHSGGFWSTYEFQDGCLKGFGLGAGVKLRDEVFIDQPNTLKLPGYAVGDLVAFYRQAHYEVQLNVVNVTDESWYRNGVNTGALPGDPLGFYGTVRVKF